MIMEKFRYVCPAFWHSSNDSYEKYIIIGWTDFNRHQIVIVIRKGFQNQPQLHPPKNIHNYRNYTQRRALSSRQLGNPLKINYSHIVVKVVISKKIIYCL